AVSLKKIFFSSRRRHFFKQKTAYEIAQCLVGSEMCIRDRNVYAREASSCLLYTSDAADDSLRVDLGGRRIIKKTIKIVLLP
ncbi:hypothetical protein, partial [Staphylococcus aureus]